MGRQAWDRHWRAGGVRTFGRQTMTVRCMGTLYRFFFKPSCYLHHKPPHAHPTLLHTHLQPSLYPPHPNTPPPLQFPRRRLHACGSIHFSLWDLFVLGWDTTPLHAYTAYTCFVQTPTLFAGDLSTTLVRSYASLFVPSAIYHQHLINIIFRWTCDLLALQFVPACHPPCLPVP